MKITGGSMQAVIKIQTKKICTVMCFIAVVIFCPGSIASGSTGKSAIIKQQFNFRALGKIEATCKNFKGGAASWTTLAASDSKHAQMTASKFVGDMMSFGDVKKTSGPATSLMLDGGGNWIVGLDGSKVQVLFSKDKSFLNRLAVEAGAEAWKAVPANAYPRWLDHFDNDAVNFGFMGWGGHHKDKDINESIKWLGDHKFSFSGELGSRFYQMVAPGIVDTSYADYYEAIAKKYNTTWIGYVGTFSPMRPEFMLNIKPLPHYKSSNRTVRTDILNHHERFKLYADFIPTATTDAETSSGDYGIFAELVKNDHFNAIHGTMELGSHGAGVAELSAADKTPGIREKWEDYLKQDRGYTLRELGRLYCGNPDAFKSWSEVPVTTIKSFTGWNPATSVNLEGEWQARNGGRKTVKNWLEKSKDWKWTKLSPSDPVIITDHTKHFYFKRNFNLTKKQLKESEFLHVSHVFPGVTPEIFINGKSAKLLNNVTGNYRFLAANFDYCYSVKNLLHAGNNTIAMDTHGQPIASYIFLNSTGLWLYPSNDSRRNLMYFDMVEFAARLVVDNAERMLLARRAASPEGRPMFIMAPRRYQDLLVDAAKRYGAIAHCTGQSGACWAPWVSRAFSSHGMPVSAEVGGPPKSAASMRRNITLYQMIGNEGINFLFHPTAYYKKYPDVGAWIDANRELMNCTGKTVRPKPSLGVLRSARNASRLGIEAPWRWDVSRGEAQAVGRPIDMLDLPDMQAGGIAGNYRVIFDAATELMTRKEVAGIENYVKNGGTFVALHNSGRHTPAQKDAWPISKLTGLKVVDSKLVAGKMRFTEKQSLWPSLRGKEMICHGIALDWTGDKTPPKSLGMEPVADNVEVVAEWVKRRPGTGRIAIAVRHLGKGKVITLGATFWRSSRDIAGSWKPDAGYRPYLAELLDSLKVPKDSRRSLKNAENVSVFAEHFYSKNGLYDLYMLAKVNDRCKPSKASIGYTRESAPAFLKEISTKGHPDVVFQPEKYGFSVSDIALDPMQLRIFAAPRSDIAEAPMNWLKSMNRNWYALTPLTPAESPAKIRIPDSFISLKDGWKMIAGDKKWMSLPPTNYWKGGRTVRLGTFRAMNVPEKDIAHFHKEVIIPESWKGSIISLRLACDPSLGGIHYNPRLWINGKPNGSGFNLTNPKSAIDLSDLSSGGKLVLDLEIDGGAVRLNARRSYPSGAAGVFFLEAVPRPIARTPLKWITCAKAGMLPRAVSGGKAPSGKYLEARFKLPSKWPAKRLFLESKDSLGLLFINKKPILLPPWMNRLDISGLVNKDDSENEIRWMFHPFSAKSAMPQIYLSWIQAKAK